MRALPDAARLTAGVIRFEDDRVGVMYLGKLVELGSVDEIFRPPSHPYTRLAVGGAAAPSFRLATDHPPGGRRAERGVPAVRLPIPTHAVKVGRICELEEPPLLRAGQSHWIACHIPLDVLRREPSVLSAALAAEGLGPEPRGEAST